MPNVSAIENLPTWKGICIHCKKEVFASQSAQVLLNFSSRELTPSPTR
jgi:hypothetical protein